MVGDYDTIITVFALCRVPELEPAVEELHRRLRPDGQLLFLEPVRAYTSLTAVQRLVSRRGWHFDRDLIAALRAHSMVVTDCERPRPLGRLTAQSVIRGRAIPRQRPS